MDKQKRKRLENDMIWLEKQLAIPKYKYVLANGVAFCLIAGGISLLLSKGSEAFSSDAGLLVRHFGVYFVAGLFVGWLLRSFLVRKKKRIESQLQ